MRELNSLQLPWPNLICLLVLNTVLFGFFSIQAKPLDVQEPSISFSEESTNFATLSVPKLQRLAEAGNPAAQFQIALNYYEGVGTIRDVSQTYHWFAKAAESGVAYAQFITAYAFYTGTFYELDFNNAAYWYSQAATRGMIYAIHNLGIMYSEGQGVEKDIEQAKELFRIAANAGEAKSEFALFYLLKEDKASEEDEISWLLKAARNGSADAQYLLALYYANGDKVEKDLSIATQWIQKSAEQGHKLAQAIFGNALINGEGVESDPGGGIEWLQKSAEQGNPHAMNDLAVIYEKGKLVPPD